MKNLTNANTIGVGKNFELKTKVLREISKGKKVRILDITGEFDSLVHALGGIKIALDETQGVINPLEVFKTGTQADDTPELLVCR